jgi:hypothetical protein
MDPAVRVLLSPIELINLDLGEDDHARHNHFYTLTTPFYNQATSAIAQLSVPTIKGRKFPLANAPSISRNGFRPTAIELETFYVGFHEIGNTSQNKNNLGVSTTYLLEANELAFDYWNKFVFYESGSLTIYGRNEIKVGKVLYLDETFPYNPNSFYYIEGYDDEFTVLEQGAASWIQRVYVTHGMEADSLFPGGKSTNKSRVFNKESSFIKKNG